MKLLRLLLLASLASISPAQAQLIADSPRGAYFSAGFGNGSIDGPGAVGYRNMRWRAFESRIGRDLNPRLVGEGSLEGAATARIDFVYYNEGHPDNNHRDGFALQLSYARRFGEALTAELSAGPYTSMNTTTLGGVQIDQARRGMLYSAALRCDLGWWMPGAHLRLGYNHAAPRGVFHSDALMVGIGRHFTDVPPFPETDLARSKLWLGGSYGRAYTSQSGTRDSNGGILETKQYGGKWALSFSAIFEGDDKTRVDRRGMAAQFWFVQPLTKAWSAQAGIGPYIAENRRDNNRTGTHGLISLQFERALSDRSKVFFAFHRVKSFQESNDRDLFHLGLLTAFGAGQHEAR
ncbi:hypothetical protein GCM10027321_17290 [Massilia terrae]|uniref:Porin n=1 Tax=Massilia terrae TaxID=1811224 RepID=A0ABT2CW64_9BURK|nr:hypothetical protein [Massilia terrae]MCS0658202.1 hypothetical protein [Massilia terrae]